MTSEVIGGCFEARYFKHFDTMEVELIKGPLENKIISQITYRRSSIGPLPFYLSGESRRRRPKAMRDQDAIGKADSREACTHIEPRLLRND